MRPFLEPRGSHPALPPFHCVTWENDLVSLCLSFLICKMRILVAPNPNADKMKVLKVRRKLSGK